jgi:hypothetical protein
VSLKSLKADNPQQEAVQTLKVGAYERSSGVLLFAQSSALMAHSLTLKAETLSL